MECHHFHDLIQNISLISVGYLKILADLLIKLKDYLINIGWIFHEYGQINKRLNLTQC